MDNRVGAV